MGPAPSLATYQQAAQSIYEPQKAADITQAQATTAADIANMESGKGQIQTDYQTAINNLTATTNANVGKINQLYTERLGGNFSGLQGNDLGSMFGKAAQAQGVIESTRANKLAAIATSETNAQNQLGATISSLTSKYQGEEANYAQSSYSSAVKEYNTEQYQQQQLALRQESIDAANARANASISAANARASARASAAADKPLTQQQTASAILQGLSSVRGSDGFVSPQDYAQAFKDWTSAGFNGSTFNNYFGQLKNPKNGYYDWAIQHA